MIRKSIWTQALALFLVSDVALDLLLIFYTNEKRDVVWKVVRCGWLCSGFARQDAEDKRARDGLEASTAKPAAPHHLLN